MINAVWKNSGHIAVVEVQGYADAAYLAAAQMYDALNGHTTSLRVLVSNPAHTLRTGSIPAEYAPRVAQTALSAELWSSCGLRTVGANEIRFNPVSYHNGSVWLHDTALAALGLARYDLHREAAQVSRAPFDVALAHLLPESVKEPALLQR